MTRVTVEAFLDELEKIGCDLPTKKLATMVKYTKAKLAEKSGKPAREANNFFGLPIEKRRRGKRQYEFEQAGAAAQSPDRSQSPIASQNTPDVGSANRIDPAYGPGGV